MMTDPPSTVECSGCTVPTDDPFGLCTFCQTYEPPADPLVVATGLANTAATVVRTALRDYQLGDHQLGIPQSIDLLTAQEHLLVAARLIERATGGEA